MEAVSIYVWYEEFFDAPKKLVETLSSLGGDALESGDKVVQVDIYLCQGVPPFIKGVSDSTVWRWS